jgi:hypothetical protein
MPQLPPPEPVEGDPFGLHDPPTLNDLCRIEEALADGSVNRDEAGRLRAIHEHAWAPMREQMKSLGPIFKLDPKVTAGINAHFADIIGKTIVRSDFAERIGAGVGQIGADAFKKIGVGLVDTAVMDKLKVDLTKLLPEPPSLNMARLLSDGRLQKRLLPQFPDTDRDIFIDRRPARMEELAEQELTTLADVCSVLSDVARLIEQGDKRAEQRHEAAMRSSRHQFHVLVVVSVVVGMFGIAAAVALSLFA